MELEWENIRIRSAKPQDAALICSWWNDGEVMAHAGFPRGIGTLEKDLAADIAAQDESRKCLCVILYDDTPIGEMNYRISEEKTAEIGINICKKVYQNHGLGKQVLSLFIGALLSDFGVRKITVDPNLENVRAQHVYEQLGFRKIAVERDSWRDQLGQLRSAVLYEMNPQDFVSYIEPRA